MIRTPRSTRLGYSRGFFNQTSVPPNPLGSCSNANCHIDGKATSRLTPAWGRASFQAPLIASQCHEVAPTTGNHPVSGSQACRYYGTGTGSCEKCHPDHTSEVKPFAHATSAGRPRDRRPLHRLTQQRRDLRIGNQCSNLYCHSNGAGGAPNVSPDLGSEPRL